MTVASMPQCKCHIQADMRDRLGFEFGYESAALEFFGHAGKQSHAPTEH